MKKKNIFGERPKKGNLKVGSITEEEHKKVCDEIRERFIDLMHQNFHRKMPKKEIESLAIDDTLKIEYTIKLIGNDIVQILGRLRR